jgi:DTW domain-containing protein YfiP
MTTMEPIEDCPRCGKALPLCICDSVTPIENRIFLLILQHPQEQDGALATARLTALHFTKAMVKVGLSWPSLQKILGQDVDPQRWAILYLGSAKAADLAPDQEIVVLDRAGNADESQRGILKTLEGVIVLDGTWSQAKALWWRNAWMLKCRRVILNPGSPSLYGNLRREPRSDGLSTLESAAILLSALEKKPAIAEVLLASFGRMLTRFREVQLEMPELAPRPKKRDWRRKRPKSAPSV